MRRWDLREAAALAVVMGAAFVLVLVLVVGVNAALAAEPSSTRIGDYTFPVDDQGAVILDEHRVAPNKLRPAERSERDAGVCVRVCTSVPGPDGQGVGRPIPGNSAWNLYCLET